MITPLGILQRNFDVLKKNSSRTSHGDKVFKMAVSNVFRNKKGTALVLGSLFLGISLFVIVNGILAGLDVSYLADEYMDDDIVIEMSPKTKLEENILDQLQAVPHVQEVSYTTKLNDQWFIDRDNVLERYIADFCGTGTVPQEAILQYANGNQDQTYLFGIGEQDFHKAASSMNSSLEYEDFCQGKIAFLASATIVPYEGTDVSGEIEILLNRKIYSIELAPCYLSATFREDGKTLLAPNIYVSQEWLEQIGVPGQINRIAVQIGNSEQALKTVKAMFEAYSGVGITSKVEKIKELKASFGGITFLGNALSVILLGIGLMNFINMMYVSVSSRGKELAVLESIGMTRKQIYRMLFIEGNTYAILTAMLIFTLGSAVLYESFQIVKTQASYAVFAYPVSQTVISLAVVTAICNLVPVFVYRTESSHSIIERLRGND